MEFTAQQNAGPKQAIQIALITELSQNSFDHSRSRTNQCVGLTNIIIQILLHKRDSTL